MDEPTPKLTNLLVENDGDTVSVMLIAPNGYVFDEFDDSGDEPTIYFKRED